MKTKSPLLLTFDLENCIPETLMGLIKDPSTAGSLLDRIAKYHHGNEIMMETLIIHPRVLPQTLLFLFNSATAQFRKRIQELKNKPAPGVESALVPFTGPGKDSTTNAKKTKERPEPSGELSLYQRIQKMTVAEKVQFALKAGKDGRSLLLKDPNRQVAMGVLSSPKITEDEIVLIAQSRNVSDDILRAVGKNKEWLKNYSVVLGLVSNPKTPPGVSIPLLPQIRPKDLGLLSKNRNVPEAIRTGANRLVLAKQRKS
jgi:hypothetical protein